MKKIYLFLFAITLFLSSYAQDRYNAWAVQTGKLDRYTLEWSYSKAERCDISFLIQGKVILVNDEARSTYYTKELLIDDEKQTAWNALDEKERNCIIKISRSKSGHLQIYVVYRDVCYVYYIRE